MSTLFDQPVRERGRVATSDVDDFLATAKGLAKKHDLDVQTVIDAKHVLELQRRNNFQVANGDAFDEQLAGFGGILNSIAESLRVIAERDQ